MGSPSDRAKAYVRTYRVGIVACISSAFIMALYMLRVVPPLVAVTIFIVIMAVAAATTLLHRGRVASDSEKEERRLGE